MTSTDTYDRIKREWQTENSLIKEVSESVARDSKRFLSGSREMMVDRYDFLCHKAHQFRALESVTKMRLSLPELIEDEKRLILTLLTL